jgi:hypothetical protein
MTTIESASSDEDRVPDRSEVRSVLEQYFTGAISDSQVDKLHSEVVAVLSDDAKWKSESGSFRANSPRFTGQAWHEVLARGHSLPTSIDLIAWLALTRPGYPEPKPWCPPIFAGSWNQVDPAGGVWQFGADGSFKSSYDRLASFSRWSVHGRGGATHTGDNIVVSTGREADRPRFLHVWELAGDDLTVDLAGGAFPDVRLKLRRR